MRLILLSGGSGKRLWPLSNDVRSKQFLKILKGPDNQPESMVQRVWRQLLTSHLAEKCIFATSANQSNMIVNQLGTKVPTIVEPERRDTFPAISLAASYLYSVQRVDLDETIIVMPVDAYVEDEFFESIKALDDVLADSSSDLALMGVQPTYPSTKYGYIVAERNSESEYFLNVRKFQEKPSEADALSLISKKNAYWNCGIFAFKLNYLIGKMKKEGIPTLYDRLIKQYSVLKKTSFDYEVVEKENRIAMLPYQGEWKDLGTWNTLTEEMSDSQIGLGTISSDSTNTHLINELHIPVTVLGVSNSIVVVSPDGVLVADKACSPRLKEMLAVDQRPMFEEHTWGTSKVLDYAKNGEEYEILTRRLMIGAGKQTGVEVHFKRLEVWSVISGTGEIYLDGKTFYVQKGFTCQIPPKTKHGIKAFSDLYLVEIQDGSPLEMDDVESFTFLWGSAVV